MNIYTKYHGRIEINSEEILKFEKGIPGFMEEKEFILLPLSGDGTFFVMQSTSTSELAFVISSPFNFFNDYDFKLDESVVSDLGLETEKDVLVYSILTVQDPFDKTTANLQAPIIINSKNKKAKQVILHNEEFKTKHPVFKKKK